LHHSNIDRLVALYQLCYPQSYFNGNPKDYNLPLDDYLDEELEPFYNADTGKYITPREVQNYEEYGYNYSGPFFESFLKHKDSVRLRAEVIKYYGTDLHYPYNYYLDVDEIEKNLIDGPYTVRVFLGKPDADEKTPETDPHFVQSIFVFARGKNVKCENCEKNDKYIRQTVYMNKTMRRLNMDLVLDLPLEPIEDQFLQNQAEQALFNVVLIAVNRAGKLIYKWDRQSNFKPEPKVSAYYTVNPRSNVEEFLNHVAIVENNIKKEHSSGLKSLTELRGHGDNLLNDKRNEFQNNMKKIKDQARNRFLVDIREE